MRPDHRVADEGRPEQIRARLAQLGYTADSVQKVDAGTDAIGLHVENGNTPRVPELIAFYCRRAAREGSATTLCDGAALLDDLPDALRARFDVPLTVTRTLPEGLWKAYLAAEHPLLLDGGGGASAAPELARLEVAGRSLCLRATGVPAVDGTRPGTTKVTFTSGSTGDPKGACLSEAQLLGPVRRIAARVGDMGVTRHLAVLPLAVLLENVAGVYAALYAGIECIVPSLATVGLAAKPVADASALRASLSGTGAHSCILVPELLRGLVAARAALGPLPALRYVAVGGARVGPALLDAAAAAGLPAHEGYGLTEAASVVTVNLPSAHRAGSTGRPLGHRGIRIAGDGEILLDAPHFLGYCGDVGPPPAPYPTGDLGRLDADGYPYVEGRAKNVPIASMGRNVSPERVEAALTGDGTILQAVVHGDGEPVPSALVTSPCDDARIDAALAAANAGLLPDYARIGAWRRVPPLTREDGLLTGNGKPRPDAVLHRYAPGAPADAVARAGDDALPTRAA